MVSLEGNIPPFRMTEGELFNVVVQINKKLDALSSPLKYIDISLGNYSETCGNISELDSFMNDVYLPKVVKNADLVIYSETLHFQFIFAGEYAKYYIRDAKDTSEARSFEDLILTAFKKHTVSRISNLFGEMLLVSASFLACFFILIPVVKSFYFGEFLAFREFYIFSAICLIAFVIYAIWTNYTPDTPSFSFYHSLIWIEQPKTNTKWALVLTILVGIAASYLTTLL